MVSYKYVILGGGMVAGYAAREFVERGVGPGELAILSSDSVPPYERPPLSKGFLAGVDSEDSILINPESFYAEHGIDLRLTTRVVRVDPNAKRLFTSAGDEFGFDKLLIATGANVRMLETPGAALDGVFSLRTFDDARRLRDASKHAQQAVVVGGGFIAMEVASVLATAGVKTTMLFPEDRVWMRLFSPEMSMFFARYYQQRDVTFVAGETATALEGTGNVTEVVTSSGRRVPADLVVAGIGVVPALDAVSDSGVTIDNGVRVNEFLETGRADVYAAGDIANYRDVIFEKQRRAEHWDNAVEQGKHAARAMLGEREPFIHVPYFFSDVFDLSYEFWGDAADADRVVYRGDVSTRSFSAWWLRDRHVRAAFVMDRPDDERERAPVWIAEHQQVDAERMSDETVPLSDLMVKS
ncbi:MAG: NAD(P)/FAD-dependent oxidoreductase [Chloroflexota bacterium]|nr:NAD(P)/FAD-dependent oxidoreductase [Chloroflexota bacterium]